MWNTHTTFQWITGYNLKMYTVTILHVKKDNFPATILPKGSKRYLYRFPFCTLTCFAVHHRERRRKNSTRILAPNLHHVGLVARPIEICSRLMLGSMVDHPAPAEKWISEPIRSIYGIFTYLHLVDLYGKCREISHTGILWVCWFSSGSIVISCGGLKWVVVWYDISCKAMKWWVSWWYGRKLK